MKKRKLTHDPITGKKLKSIFIRCSDEEKKRWQEASRIEGRSLAGLIRYSIMRMCGNIEDRVKDPHS